VRILEVTCFENRKEKGREQKAHKKGDDLKKITLLI